MSYDPNLTTDKDKVRNLIGDTDPDNEFLSDSEIDFFVGEAPNVTHAAADAALAVAARMAKEVDFRFSTLWQDASEAYDHFQSLANELRDRATRNVGSPITTSPISGADDEDFGDPVFSIGMHDNLKDDNENDD